MRVFLLFVLFIYAVNANIIQNEDCFQIDENNIIIETTTLTMRGNGKMCDCKRNELKEYRDLITKIIFDDTVTQIGSQCFISFYRLKTIQFGKGVTK